MFLGLIETKIETHAYALTLVSLSIQIISNSIYLLYIEFWMYVVIVNTVRKSLFIII